MSRTVIAPTTSLGEQQRQNESSQNSFPGGHEGLRQMYGIISAVHPKSAFIKAKDSKGYAIANDRWIPLLHTVKEINDRFGTVQTGMYVLVSYAGADGEHANALIIAESGEKHGEPNRPNEFSLSSWRLFQ